MAGVPRSDPSAQFRAAIYTRVSTLEQSERGDSLEAQAQDRERLAVELGAQIVETYQAKESRAPGRRRRG